MEKITIESIEPARKKTGELVQGVSKNGNGWQLFKINNKYSFFHFGEDEPAFEIGGEYEFVVEESEKDGYINYTISMPRKGDKERDETQRTFEDMRRAFAKLQKQVNDLEAEFKLLKEFLTHS